jgi:hypothetical protein
MRIYSYRGHAIGVEVEPGPWASWQTKARWRIFIDGKLWGCSHSPWDSAREHIDDLVQQDAYAGMTIDELFEALAQEDSKNDTL